MVESMVFIGTVFSLFRRLPCIIPVILPPKRTSEGGTAPGAPGAPLSGALALRTTPPCPRRTQRWFFATAAAQRGEPAKGHPRLDQSTGGCLSLHQKTPLGWEPATLRRMVLHLQLWVPSCDRMDSL